MGRGIYNLETYKKDNTFNFLNYAKTFGNTIDWNYSSFGKLWTYNLNYFDYLNQENISKQTGIILIKNFIKNDNLLIDGKEPYPISIRGLNWIKFLSKIKSTKTLLIILYILTIIFY